jgi:hypothetical protein
MDEFAGEPAARRNGVPASTCPDVDADGEHVVYCERYGERGYVG